MKSFKLLRICLMSFIAIPCMHGMDFGMDLSDIPTNLNLSIPEEKPSEIPMQQLTKKSSPLNKNQGLFNVLYSQENKQPTKHFISSVTPMGTVSSILTEKNDLVIKDVTIPLLAYPSVVHPIAKVFADLNYAKIKNNEGLLAQALQNFKRNSSGKYRGFTVNPIFLRIK